MRPFGYVHAWCGGKEKSLEGHFSFFSVDQSYVGGVINNYNSIRNTAKNIFIVLCGRMTPAQKSIARRQADINTEVFMDLLTWYIKESGHLGYDGFTPPDECPNPVIVLQDEDSSQSSRQNHLSFGNTQHEVHLNLHHTSCTRSDSCLNLCSGSTAQLAVHCCFQI